MASRFWRTDQFQIINPCVALCTQGNGEFEVNEEVEAEMYRG